jgi:hypothetical protein
MATVSQVLRGMRDADADAADVLMEEDIRNLSADSVCGRDVVRVFRAVKTACDLLELSDPGFFDGEEESRWCLWSKAVRVARVFYFG